MAAKLTAIAIVLGDYPKGIIAGGYFMGQESVRKGGTGWP